MNRINDIDLSVDLAGVKLANPMMTASGTCGYGDEYADLLDLRELGAFVTKSITLEPRLGNEYPRIVETRAGMMNAIGLANVGLKAFIKDKVPDLEKMGVPLAAAAPFDQFAFRPLQHHPAHETMIPRIFFPEKGTGLSYRLLLKV